MGHYSATTYTIHFLVREIFSSLNNTCLATTGSYCATRAQGSVRTLHSQQLRKRARSANRTLFSMSFLDSRRLLRVV